MLELIADMRTEWCELDGRIAALNAEFAELVRANPQAGHLVTIPGVGVLGATAMVAAVGSGDAFRRARDLAAWLGLTPRSNSSGGKERLGRITKAGNRYLRTLLVIGATAVVGFSRRTAEGPLMSWVRKLLQVKSARLTTVALANKMARICWAVMARKTVYGEAAA